MEIYNMVNGKRTILEPYSLEIPGVLSGQQLKKLTGGRVKNEVVVDFTKNELCLPDGVVLYLIQRNGPSGL